MFRNKNKFIKALAVIGLLISSSVLINSVVFSSVAYAANTNSVCTPAISSFTVTPNKVIKRNQAVNLTVRVKTFGCIIDDYNEYKYFAKPESVDDKGEYTEAFDIPFANIRGSDFKNTCANCNEFYADYKLTPTDLFAKTTGTTISLRANMWKFNDNTDYTRVVENKSLTYKITAPAVNPNDPIDGIGGGAGGNGGGVGGPGKGPGTPGATPFPTIPPSSVGSGANYGEELGSLMNPLNSQNLPQLIASIIKVLLALIAMVAVLVIIVSGFRMVLNGGDPGALTKAKNGIIWAILGLIVALMSFSIVAILQNLISK